jgi:Domain of unknown function DUF29
MSNSEEKALLHYLVVLIWHIIKWYTQPWARSSSWRGSINNTRKQINKLLRNRPTLRRLIDGLIPKAFKEAKPKAEREMEIPTEITELTRKQLFDDPYELEK